MTSALRRLWTGHRWLAILGLAGVIVAALVAIVHVPFTRARVLAWVVDRLETDAGIRADVERLDYNLLTLRVALGPATLTAVGAEQPFLTVDRVAVDLPWSIVSGTIAVESLEIIKPVITVVRHADESLNLPAGAEPEDAVEPEPAGEPLAPIEIGRLLVDGLEVGYVDRPLQLSVDGRAVTLDMAEAGASGLAGRIAMDGGVALAMDERSTTVSRLDGRLRFDGRALGFEDFTIEAPELRLAVDGHVDLLAEAPRVDARYRGRVNLAQLVPWVAPDEDVSGAIDFSGTAAGPLDAPDVALTATASDLGWRDQQNVTLDLAAAMSASAATVERLRLGLGGGALEGTARIGLDEAAASRADLTWTQLDLGALARTAGVTEPRIAALSEGALRAEWRGNDVTGATARVETTLTSRGAGANEVALGGGVTAAIDEGVWTLDLAGLSTRTIRLDGRASGRVDAEEVNATTVDGTLAAEVPSVPALVAELGRAGLAMPESPLAAGSAALDLTLSGTVGAPEARGRLTAADLDLEGLRPGSLDVDFAASPARIDISSFRFALEPNTASGQLQIDLETRAMTGAFTADLPRLGPLAVTLPPESRPEGAATLKADIGGTLDAPAVDVVAGITSLAVAGQQVDRVDLTARLARNVVTVERLRIDQGGGRLNATGTYALASGRYTVSAEGRGLVVRPIDTGAEPIPLDTAFDLDLAGEGTVADPGARLTLAVRDLAYGAYVVGAARVEATVAGNDLAVTATVPSLQTALDAKAALAAPRRFTARLAMTNAALDTLMRESGPAGPVPDAAPDGGPAAAPIAVTGAITATAVASGDLDRPTDAIVDLDLRLVDVTAGGAPIRLDRPARLRYEAGRIIAEDVAVRSGGTSLTATGRFGRAGDTEGLRVTLDGTLADFVPFARLAEGLETFEASGGVRLNLHAAGALEAPAVEATLAVTGATVSMPDLPAVTGVQVEARFEEGLLTLGTLGAAWQGATLSGSGTLPVTLLGEALPEGYVKSLPPLADRARARIRLDSVTASAIAPFVDDATLDQIEAALAVDAAIEATTLAVEDVTAEVTLNRAEFLIAGERLAQDRPTRLTLAGGRLAVADWAWSGTGNRVAVAGGAMLTGETPTLDATLTGSLDLRMLGAVSPDLAAGGRADFDFRATGPLAEPAIEGELKLADGELAIREPRFALTDLTGLVAVTRDRVRLIDVRASANGGSLQVGADIALDGFEPASGAVEIQGRGLALEVPENLRSEVDLDLRFNVSPDTPELTGTVTVLRGSYRAPLSLTNQLLSGVEVEPAAPAEPGLVDRIRLSIDVVSKEGIVVDNNYGSLEISTDLKVVGTPAQPALAGRLTIEEGGAVFLAGQTWALERGTVDFTSATRIEPNLDLLLVTRVQRFDVRLSVTGTPETLEANLSSPDGISQADAVSLLLTGQLADEQSMAQSEIARGQLLLLLSGELLGFAGRAVGLDSAQVGRGLGGAASSFDLLATDTDPSARLTITKQLRQDVELVFSQSLSESNDLTWIAIYRPIRAIELRTTTLDDNSRTYEFRNELNFGGRRPQRTSAARDEGPRVSAVRWTGSPGFDEPTLRGRIKLDEGDRFDFYRLQQDRDRLEAFFRDRGFLEARIRSSREQGPADEGEATVVLTYAIERGPATSLTVEGASLPGGVLEDMRETWARSMFDGFLRDDLERLAFESLAAEGYLQAEAEAVITEDEAAGTKQVVVRLTPGSRFSDRRLAFEGQQGVEADELEAVIDERRLALTAWLRPAEVEGAIEAHYRSLGYQNAEVAIGEAVFEGATATLPVRIEEGPRFQVASVTVEGVSARPLNEVREEFGVEAQTPYQPGDLEPARRAVEIGYLREGYNDVRVSVTSVADAEAPSAHITLTVAEGPQQVLQDVAVTGNAITTPGTVTRALNLDVGEPAEVSDAFRAQKRLYDTGVFRRADVEFEPMAEASNGTQPVRAAVTLEEIQPYRLRYGVRLTDDTGPLGESREFRPGFVVDFLRRNLFGRALSAGVAGQIEADRRLARTILSTPQFFGWPVTSNLFLTRSRQDFTPEGFSPFVEDASEVTAEQRFRPHPAMAVSYDYRYRRTRVFEITQSGDSSFDLQVNIARLTGTYAWDTRDDPFNARSGWLRSVGVQYAAESLGSDARFLKFTLQNFFFRTVGESVVLASAVRLGSARGFDQDLIPSERFFVGGGTSVRGFAEDALGEIDFLGDPVGGNASLILNQEVRFPIYRWIRGVGFLDAGNVFPLAGDLSLDGLDAGAGFGLRIDTPFGLARIDFGMPLSRRDREPFGRWYFSLGQAF